MPPALQRGVGDQRVADDDGGDAVGHRMMLRLVEIDVDGVGLARGQRRRAQRDSDRAAQTGSGMDAARTRPTSHSPHAYTTGRNAEDCTAGVDRKLVNEAAKMVNEVQRRRPRRSPLLPERIEQLAAEAFGKFVVADAIGVRQLVFRHIEGAEQPDPRPGKCWRSSCRRRGRPRCGASGETPGSPARI